MVKCVSVIKQRIKENQVRSDTSPRSSVDEEIYKFYG